MAVDDVPVVEVTSFILYRGTVLVVVDAECLHLVPAEALLNLPAGHVGETDRKPPPRSPFGGVLLCDEGCACANDGDGLFNFEF